MENIDLIINKVSELEKLLVGLGARERIVVMPILNALEVFVDYHDGQLMKIYRMIDGNKIVLMSRELDDEEEEDDPKVLYKQQQFKDRCYKMGLPLQIKNPLEHNHLTRLVTFSGYVYIPEQIYQSIDRARESGRMQRYASNSDLCTRILYGETVEFLAKDNIRIVLTDVIGSWKNTYFMGDGRVSNMDKMNQRPHSWEDAIKILYGDNLPFSPVLFYNSKNELIKEGAERNPFLKLGLDYDVIGIRINIDSFAKIIDGLASFSHYYKMKPIKIILDKVMWEMTMTGKLLPYATYEEQGQDKFGQDVKILRRIYLYSPRYILDNDITKLIKRGDEIFVGKGPDGSRYIQRVNYSARGENEDSYDLIDIPDECPYCRSNLVPFDESSDGHLYCTNPFCFERIVVFCVTMSRSIVLQDRRYEMINSYDTMRKHIMRIRDQYPEMFQGSSDDTGKYSEPYPYMTQLSIPIILGFNKKDAKIKNIPLSVFLTGLGINGLTTDLAEALATKFKSVAEIGQAFLDSLEKVPNMPETVAKDIYSTFGDPFYRRIIESMAPYLENKNDEVVISKDEEHLKDRDKMLRKMFLNKVVVFDGADISHYREIVDFIEYFGGIITKDSIDPTTGDIQVYYDTIEGGRSKKVYINMNSEKMRDRYQFVVHNKMPSRITLDAMVSNDRITDQFRDSDNPEKLLSLLVTIFKEEDIMTMINNYHRENSEEENSQK